MTHNLDTQSLLKVLTKMKSKPRVLLDVGAQVIDSTNLDLAQSWLIHYWSDEKTQAVVFFNDQDEIMVLDKKGEIQELQTSPYADQMDQCLVYLDEAHTRGIDLRLPADYQAAVTLGANVTKDRLVKACMRMRKLGKGQSVVFLIPQDIEQEIRLICNHDKTTPFRFTVFDVLSWSITETCKEQRRAVPVWLNQGLRFTKQQPFWDALLYQEEDCQKMESAEKFREADAPTLDMRYRPRRALIDVSSELRSVHPRYALQFRDRCQQFGLTEMHHASFDEEQVRELAPEAEQERQIQKLPNVEPAEHQIHPGLKRLICEGTWPTNSFLPAFETLRTTSAAQNFDVSEFPSTVLVTQDFATTVRLPLGPRMYSDPCQKPVQWILTTRRDPEKLIVISSFEVQQLLPSIEQSKHVKLHLYSAKVNSGYDSLDHLDLFIVSRDKSHRSVPRTAVSLLCQFSGQLYLSSFDDYVEFCRSLGLAWEVANDDVMLGPDGFIIINPKQGSLARNPGFSKSPVSFMKILATRIRQNSEYIERTHVGKILQGVRLFESDFTV